jgi:hypothetical protein
LGLGAIFAAGGCEAPKPAVTAAQLEDAPLTISVSTVGVFAKGRPWHLSVNSAGQAELTINKSPLPIGASGEVIRKQFQVTKEQLGEFRKALAEERFFDLAGEYGQRVPDGSEQVVTVAAGRHANTVRIHFLMNRVASKDKAKLREPARAVRLLVLVRGWFDEAEAVDLREFGRAVLDAAKE